MRRAGTPGRALATLGLFVIVVVLAAASGLAQVGTAADGTTFTLVSAPPKSTNTHVGELTIDAVHHVAIEDHCCDGGKWKIEYSWNVPQSFTTGKSTTITLTIKVDDSGPNQNSYQMNALAPDFAQALPVTAPGGPMAPVTKTFTWQIAADQNASKEIGITIGFVSSGVTYMYKPGPALGLAASFKVDTHANDVRVGPPLVGWWQLCLSRLNGSGSIGSDGKLATGGKLFQSGKCPKVRGGPRTLDTGVMWQVVKAKLSKANATLNFGTHGDTEVETLVLTAKVISTSDQGLCPVGTLARVTLIADARRLDNGFQMDRAEVHPVHKCLGQVQGWSNADNPNNDPPHGGLGGGQHAQVNIDDK